MDPLGHCLFLQCRHYSEHFWAPLWESYSETAAFSFLMPSVTAQFHLPAWNTQGSLEQSKEVHLRSVWGGQWRDECNSLAGGINWYWGLISVPLAAAPWEWRCGDCGELELKIVMYKLTKTFQATSKYNRVSCKYNKGAETLVFLASFNCLWTETWNFDIETLHHQFSIHNQHVWITYKILTLKRMVFTSQNSVIFIRVWGDHTDCIMAKLQMWMIIGGRFGCWCDSYQEASVTFISSSR